MGTKDASVPNRSTLSPDRALADPEDDRLGYAPFAKHLAHGILRGCPAEGLVVALYGAWGTGKSTILNFILRYLEQDPDNEAPIVVRFNPWWFAGQEDLVRRFFRQFEASLFKAKARRRRLLKKVAAFSEAIATTPVPYAASAAKVVKALVEAGDVVALKEELVSALASEATRVVVVIDDIDRLDANEIRQLFQLVKAIADFPNVIYLLAFDRDVVVSALDLAVGNKGNDYLEKIVQVPFAIPPVDRSKLQALLFTRLNSLLGDVPEEQFDQQHWGNIYLDGIEPFIRKPRDVVRLINALSVTYPAVAGEVNVVDFIAVEAFRLFVPAAYEIVRVNSEMFAGSSARTSDSRFENERIQKFHNDWLKQVGRDGAVVQKMLTRLFPRLVSVWGNTVYGGSSLTQWRKTLRVCSPEVFSTYFRLSVPEDEVSAATLTRLLEQATDPKATGDLLIELARQKRSDGHTRATSLLTRLHDFIEKDMSLESLEGILVALFDVGDDINRCGKKTTNPLDLGDHYRIGWVVQAILKRLDPGSRGQVLSRAMASGRSLMTIVREVVYFGRQHGKWGNSEKTEGERLLAAEDLTMLEEIVRKRIASVVEDQTIWNPPISLVLLDAWAMFGNADDMRNGLAERLQADDVLVEFVGRFITHVHSHGMTDLVARETLLLDPKVLEAYVDLNWVAPRLEALRTRGNLSAETQAVLDAFHRGKKARDAGRDARGFGDFDDE